MDIWKTSIQDPVTTIVVIDDEKVRWERVLTTDLNEMPTIRYNYDACGVAYALSRHNRIE